MRDHHADDDQIGRVLSRREVLASLGAAGAALLAGGATPRDAAALAAKHGLLRYGDVMLPECIVRPEQTEGPYFVDERLNRSDIRSDPGTGSVKPGSTLHVIFRVSRLNGTSCAALPGAHVDLWQCDASGVYSDVTDTNGLFNTRGQKFLRGYQVTNAEGIAEFQTIYPGFYQGRTVHLHFKIRTDPAAARGFDFTSQLYFDDALTDRVFGRAPYSEHAGRRTRNEQDGIFRQGGRDLMLALTEAHGGHMGTFDVGLQIG